MSAKKSRKPETSKPKKTRKAKETVGGGEGPARVAEAAAPATHGGAAESDAAEPEGTSGATADPTNTETSDANVPIDTAAQAPPETPETPPDTPPKKRVRNQSGADKPRKVSALDAAARVLAEADQPMTCTEMIVAMAEKGYWSSPGGKTPQATLYAAILREIGTKGNESRFRKTDRGHFARRDTV